MKNSTFKCRAPPAKKELNRAQVLALRARRAIESAAATALIKKESNSPGAMAVCATAATAFVASYPKDQHLGNARLLAMAKGMLCLLRITGTCNRDPSTTVAAHSNWGIHSKGGQRKAHDCYSCWGCSTCHRWLDQEGAPKTEKLRAFMVAHADQVLVWRQIATDPARPPADRKAAKWALDALNASPTGEPP